MCEVAVMYTNMLEQLQQATQLELRITRMVEKSKNKIGKCIILRQYKRVTERS
jgi:hypothetical protein